MNAVFPPWPIREFRERGDGIPESGREDSIVRGVFVFRANVHTGAVWFGAAALTLPMAHRLRPVSPPKSSSKDFDLATVPMSGSSHGNSMAIFHRLLVLINHANLYSLPPQPTG